MSLYKRIIFCFDGDKAGNLASIKTAYACLSYLSLNIFIGFILLPYDYDPDSYINFFGKESFFSLIHQPVYILDHIYRHLCFGLNLGVLYDKVRLINNINSLVKVITDLLLRKMIFNHFVNKINIHILLNNKKNDNKQKHSYLDDKSRVLSLGMKACIFLLTRRDLLSQINIDKLISNRNIKFKSDINTFFELVFLLKKNINISFADIKRKILGAINFRNDEFSFMLNNMSDDILFDEFGLLLDKIARVGSFKNSCNSNIK